MQVLHILLVVTAAVFQSGSDYFLVRSVVDGNTIVVSGVGRVRLLGVDASAGLEREARDKLTGLVLNRWVRLEHDGAERATYNRRRAYVLTGDGTFVNAVMVREGLARVAARGSRALTRLAELERAEADARAFRRGVWGRTAPIPRARYNKRP